ncbi:MAG: hypothetical protein LBK47_02040 [Prevotellaceae bacterium]|nr:hypothetical protein [Prevotellaceae bacterium]
MTGDGGSSVPLRFTRNDGAAWGKKVFGGGCAVANPPLLQKAPSFRPSPRGTSGHVEEPFGGTKEQRLKLSLLLLSLLL